MPRLTVGMAVYDDVDGLYFTLQALRSGHPELLGEVEFVVVDNHPGDEPSSKAIRSLVQSLPGCRYIPFAGYASTTVRDLVFRAATSEYVLCVDSHVLLMPGALQALMTYFDAHPDTRDLIQGPLVLDPLTGPVLTHCEQEWSNGLWGRWAYDPRGQNPAGEPFEIGMQGMGLFACRTDAWPGFNPRLRGHGGEEGYLHEKFRREGAKVICHPGVRWLHRASRSEAITYPMVWSDRARNYLLIADELGLGDIGMHQHLIELFDEPIAQQIIDLAQRETASPYAAYDAVFCLHTGPQQQPRARLDELGIGWLVEHFTLPDPALLSLIISSARWRGLQNLLLLHADHLPEDQPVGALDGVVLHHTDFENVINNPTPTLHRLGALAAPALTT